MGGQAAEPPYSFNSRASPAREFNNPLTITASPLAFTSSLPKQKHSRPKYHQLRRLRFAKISSQTLTSKRYNSLGLRAITHRQYMKRNTEKLKLARIFLKRLQTPSKRKLYTQQEKVSRSYYFSPYFKLFCSIVISIPIQTLIITLLLNVLLTVPKGAWATCEYR